METLKAYHSKAKTQQQQITHKASNLTDNDSTMVSPLPELKHSAADGEGWITFDKPILYIYAGKGPYVSRDFMQFPVSMPDDGLIDVVVHEVVRASVQASLFEWGLMQVVSRRDARCSVPWMALIADNSIG